MRGKKLFARSSAVLVFAAGLFGIDSQAVAQTETVLYSFGASGSDGTHPYDGVILDASGNLYGTTENGGAYGYGTVFKLSPQAGGGWTETVLHSFGSGIDGQYPYAGLTIDAAGNLYGTAYQGGTYFYGAVFALRPTAGGGWTEELLHSFNHNGKDGATPACAVTFDASGNLYGTTIYGGVHNHGTVFELTPHAGGGWTEKVLHSFASDTDGDGPQAGVIFDAAGNLYGTTVFGGKWGDGIAFQLTPTAGGGWAEKKLHTFGTGRYDGQLPHDGLILDAAGNLIGTTFDGGPHGYGTVFELSPEAGGSWTETMPHSFGVGDDGRYTYSSLILDANGNLYGTTYNGGVIGLGVVFELSPVVGVGWMETVLYQFGYRPDGESPVGGVSFDAAGNLYGTTYQGGAYNDGTVFEITP